MRALWPYLALYKRHKWLLLLGIVLAIVTLLASIGLLTLSGWFLSASAVVGVAGIYSFNYMLPAAGVRGVGVDVAFQHDLGRGRHLQRHAQRGHDVGARAAQQAGELVFAQGVGHGRDGAQDGGRVGADRHRHRVRLAGVLLAVLGKVQRPAAVRQPAQDDLVAA